METTRTASPSDTDLPLASWSAEPSLREDGAALFHALSAAGLLAPRPPAEKGGPESGAAGEAVQADPAEEETCSAALALLLALFRAERGFIFEVRGGEAQGQAAEVGSCFVSRNLDGETVSQPERKVPLAALRETLFTRQPTMGGAPAVPDPAPSEAAAPGRPHSLCLPLEATGSLQGLAYVENRFQPLEVTRDGLRLARAYALVLGSLIGMEKARKENLALWKNLTRLREEAPAPPQGTPGAPARPRELSRSGRRGDVKGDYSAIIGTSPKMIEIFQVLDRISSSNAPVLINGESGTGKELIAVAVHENSPRRGKVFVSENCGALTETLLESELFGYVKGAFTGASKDHKGLFELAEGGTLFLDEVGDMSPGMQKKLLRVLQEGVIRRVGGKDYIPVNVRIISATNKDLLEEVRTGSFREDLFYRLHVIRIHLPPLRERKEDIPLLIEHFLNDIARREEQPKLEFSAAAMNKALRYRWPGNIRELKNVVEQAVIMCPGKVVEEDQLNFDEVSPDREPAAPGGHSKLFLFPFDEAKDRFAVEYIQQLLTRHDGNITHAAREAGIKRQSLHQYIRKFGIDTDRFRKADAAPGSHA
ncbi:MAG: sigma-54-dependent Fis family transcriptional regulator [Planctomycetes bacterium]|nr:sigma-54-dependent Fis family transcriptional regulator [Planctomycetota bacterium]